MNRNEPAFLHLKQFLNHLEQPELPSLQWPLEHLRMALALLYPESTQPAPLHAPQVFNEAQLAQARTAVQAALEGMKEREPDDFKSSLEEVYQQLSGVSAL